MEDYYAAIKDGEFAKPIAIADAFNRNGITCKLIEGDPSILYVGDANDSLELKTNDNGLVVFVTWNFGEGDEMVLELTPEILLEFGLSNHPNAKYI